MTMEQLLANGRDDKPKGKARLDFEFRIVDFVIVVARTCEVH